MSPRSPINLRNGCWIADSSFAAHLLEIDVTGDQRLAGDSTCGGWVFQGTSTIDLQKYRGFLWFPMVSLRCSLLIMGMVWGSVGLIGP